MRVPKKIEKLKPPRILRPQKIFRRLNNERWQDKTTSEDAAGEILVLFKNAVFPSSNTQDQLKSFNEISNILDNFSYLTRNRIFNYFSAPDILFYFQQTSDAEKIINNLSNQQAKNLMGMLCSDYSNMIQLTGSKRVERLNLDKSQVKNYFKITFGKHK